MIENLMHLAKNWTRNIKMGKIGEKILFDYLAHKGYQPQPIVHRLASEENVIYSTELKTKIKKETIFDPDFLVCSHKEIFFAEAKYKTHKACLGWIDTYAYDNYYNTMKWLQCKNLGFKTYFIIKETHEIYCLPKLLNPKEFKIQGNVYVIPKKQLKFCSYYQATEQKYSFAKLKPDLSKRRTEE